MKKFIRLFVTLLALPAVLLLTGCGTSGNGSVQYSVYGGYGYPYYGYGYGGCCYDRPDRPDKPDRPDRPENPDRPVNLPSKPDRPSTQPVPRSSASMGQPSRSQMSRPNRASRGGGRR